VARRQRLGKTCGEGAYGGFGFIFDPLGWSSRRDGSDDCRVLSSGVDRRSRCGSAAGLALRIAGGIVRGRAGAGSSKGIFGGPARSGESGGVGMQAPSGRERRRPASALGRLRCGMDGSRARRSSPCGTDCDGVGSMGTKRL
jgi:hypothetical protein